MKTELRIKANQSPALARIAWLLDSSIAVPGTNWKIGLDPFLGLIPVLGDFLPNILSLAIVLEGAKRGVSNFILMRMIGNVLIDTVVGAVPLFGDIFDFVWKASARNIRLLESAAGSTSERSAGQGLTRIIQLLVILLFMSLFFVSLMISLLLFQLFK